MFVINYVVNERYHFSQKKLSKKEKNKFFCLNILLSILAFWLALLLVQIKSYFQRHIADLHILLNSQIPLHNHPIRTWVSLADLLWNFLNLYYLFSGCSDKNLLNYVSNSVATFASLFKEADEI